MAGKYIGTTEGYSSRGRHAHPRGQAVRRSPPIQEPPHIVAAWVRDAATGAPLSGARYEIVREGATIVASGTTTALAPIEQLVQKGGRYVLRVLEVEDARPGHVPVRGAPYLASVTLDARPPGRTVNPPDVLVALPST